jgi:hypothetical protein
MPNPFTIRIFVPDGDPEGIRIIDRMNWTGLGIAFPRERWASVRDGDFLKGQEGGPVGVYVLLGHDEDDDLPLVYIGESDGVRSRLQSHADNKDFWSMGVVFISPSSNLNKMHVQWLEYALVRKAQEAGRAKLTNNTTPKEPTISVQERADCTAFLQEMLQILPLVNLRVFEKPIPVSISATTVSFAANSTGYDTIVVPAREEGFKRVFLGEHCWFAIRIAAGKIGRFRWIAGYQVAPVSAITHVAEIDRIEPYGDDGKYKVFFKAPATQIGPIPIGASMQGAIQGPRYTSHKKLLESRTIADLMPWG